MDSGGDKNGFFFVWKSNKNDFFLRKKYFFYFKGGGYLGFIKQFFNNSGSKIRSSFDDKVIRSISLFSFDFNNKLRLK